MHRLVYFDKGLSLMPAIYERLVDQIGPDRYDETLGPDRFTVREVVAHVTDMEPVMRGRMELALAHPGAQVANFDQDAEAIAKNYAAWEVEETLSLFAAERQKTVELFNSITEEQRQLTVKHPILGEVSVFDIAVFVLGHDTYHVEQLTQYLLG